MIRLSNITLLLLIAFFAGTSCNEDTFQPKPTGYFRIDFPQKTYQTYKNESCPYYFEYPEYSNVSPYTHGNQLCWFNIDFPKQKARIHFSYYPLENNLAKYMEESRTLAYKHTVKAIDIEEKAYKNEEKDVFSMVYNIYGNTASSVQFFVTDSTSHFLRGALYFSCFPNSDSLSPSIEFIKKDIDHLIQTFEWE